MGFTAKGKRDNSNESWGLGFFLVFFPDINEKQQQQHHHPSSTTIDIAHNNNRNTFKTTPSPAAATTPPPPSPLTRRPAYPHSHLLSRAQSTISVCALLVFLSLLLFTLSSFEPTIPPSSSTTRRHLSASSTRPKPIYQNTPKPSSPALQGLGKLHRKGTKHVNDLIVGHAPESLTEQELRLFLRLFYKSPLSSKSDLLVIFPSPSHSSAFDPVIYQETESFFKLVHNRTSTQPSNSKPAESTRSGAEREFSDKKEPIWGRGVHSSELTRASYGSVVSFAADELDPENSLSGFLDHAGMGMRRWACYPMLLGRVRKNFKHVVLLDVKELLLVGDPLSRIRNRSPESVLLFSAEAGGGHGRKGGPAKAQSGKRVNSAAVMGGARGVRRLSSAMLTEIVRVTTQHKKKSSVTESGLFNQLVGNQFILKNVNVVISAESIPDASSLGWGNSDSGFPLSLSNYTMLWRGNSESTAVILKHVCGVELNSSVYSDCL